MEPSGFECPICLELMCDPISFPCGHNFCSKCKKRYFKLGCVKCPVCRRLFPRKQYKVNLLIKRYIQYICGHGETNKRILETSWKLNKTLRIMGYVGILILFLAIGLFYKYKARLLNRLPYLV